MIKLIHASAVVTLMLSQAVAAEATSLPTSIDPNQDGVVTREEFLSLRSDKAFSGDENGDNLLSPEEFGPMIPSRVPRRMRNTVFSQFDGNGDGYVDYTELMVAPARAFDQADKNGDGSITDGEVDELKSQLESSGLLDE